MGGGGTRRKAKKRQDSAAREMEEANEAEIRDQVHANKDDKDLFVIDVGGSKRRRKKNVKGEVCSTGTSKGDLEFLHRLKKGTLKRFRSVDLSGKERRKQHDHSSSLKDLWVDDIHSSERGEGFKRTRRRNDCTDMRMIGPCEPGQSYNPSEEDHENLLSKAVELEVKRNEVIKAAEQCVENGMSEETKALLIEDDETSEDSCTFSEDEKVFIAPIKPTHKLTRAERNKQKRKRALQRAVKEKAQRLAQKMQEDSILEIAEEVEMVAVKATTRQEERQRQREQNLKKRGTVIFPTKADAFSKVPSIPVTLREDISGSLRKLQQQGNNLLVDRVCMMAEQKVHPELRPQVILPKGIGNVRIICPHTRQSPFMIYFFPA